MSDCRSQWGFAPKLWSQVMEITIQRDEFNSALQIAKRIVERRNTIPILSNVLLSAADGVLSIRASNLDMESSAQIACEGPHGGAVTLPAHMLAEIVKGAPKGAAIVLSSIDDDKPSGARVALRFGAAASTINALPVADFPTLDKPAAFKWSHRFAMPAPEFKRLLDATTFAISTEETRYYLNGVYFHVPAGKGAPLRMVTTDGHRLARADAKAPKGAAGMPGIIIPRLCVAELSKLVAKDKGEISISLNTKYAEFRVGGAVLLSKLVDGTFPDYGRVVPSGNDRRLSVDKGALVAAVKRVSAMSSERGKAVRMTIGANSLSLAVNNPDSGETAEQIDAETAGATGLEIGFNARYLLDLAGAVKGESIAVAFSDAKSPAVFTDKADSAVMFVLMPLRV
jgi:DNA polymerase-3 subunit beta